eukprot:31846-Prorocentrum_minimum.AAC.4
MSVGDAWAMVFSFLYRLDPDATLRRFAEASYRRADSASSPSAASGSSGNLCFNNSPASYHQETDGTLCASSWTACIHRSPLALLNRKAFGYLAPTHSA